MSTEYLNESLDFNTRVDLLVSEMTIDEKISQMLHFSPEIRRLNIKGYTWWNEALHGVARAGTATVFPQAIALAATFNESMMFNTASIISGEARAKHHEFLRNNDTGIYKGLTMWSPNINIFRDPRWGRGHETFGEDPYLTGRMGVSFVKGMQGNDSKYLKTVATPKHYAVHSGPESHRHHFNAIVSDKDLRETYLPAFRDCVVEGKAFSVMGAYNRTNGEACCASKTLLCDILRDEFKFEGYVVSDCHAICDLHLYHHLTDFPHESAALAVKNGCDLNCGKTYASLIQAYHEGLITEDEIDQAVKRLFLARFKLGMFDSERNNPYAKIPFEKNDCQEHRDYAIKVAEQSIVLLKNNGVLPMSRNIRTIAVVGPNADDREVLLANYNGIPSRYSTVLEGIIEKFNHSEVLYSKGCHIANMQVREDEASLQSEAVSCAKRSDLTVIVTGISSKIEGEEADPRYPEFGGGDREDIELPGLQNQLIEAIADTGKPFIVINLSGSAIALNQASEKADALIQ
ncbi:MAG: glycoside hydrolase family 3 C-terminal domain-containing protein, partial [Clostridia bacterium]|nr:glycoside hydrolase family 3 C-terminal domain-containing protein [Clostridia bacterium]